MVSQAVPAPSQHRVEPWPAPRRRAITPELLASDRPTYTVEPWPPAGGSEPKAPATTANGPARPISSPPTVGMGPGIIAGAPEQGLAAPPPLRQPQPAPPQPYAWAVEAVRDPWATPVGLLPDPKPSWEVPAVPQELVMPKTEATPAKAMPSISVVEVHIPEAVVEHMLVKQEQIAAETVAAKNVRHQLLKRARNAVWATPLPPVGRPPPSDEPRPPTEPPPPLGPPVAARPRPVAHWKIVSQKPAAIAERVAPTWLGPQDTGRLNVDPQEMLRTLASAVAHRASTTTVWPAVVLGPPQWMDNRVARFCEDAYMHPKERFIQLAAQQWWRPVLFLDGRHPP